MKKWIITLVFSIALSPLFVYFANFYRPRPSIGGEVLLLPMILGIAYWVRKEKEEKHARDNSRNSDKRLDCINANSESDGDCIENCSVYRASFNNSVSGHSGRRVSQNYVKSDWSE